MVIIIKKVLSAMQSAQRSNSIVVFVGELELIPLVYTELTSAVSHVEVTCPIDIEHIDNSTVYLRGHRYCTSFYHDSCFRHISTHEFLETHYKWLWATITKLYDKQRDIAHVYSVEDLFQDICMKYLDRILSKYDPANCNLRVFVANRLRRYVDYCIKEQLKIRYNELAYLLSD